MKQMTAWANSGYHVRRKERGNKLHVSAKDELILHLWAEKDNTTLIA